MMIIVSGLPGSGKSYFASRLAKDINAEYLNSDVTRQEMDARGVYAFDDKLNVYEEMARRAGEVLREGRTAVIDATFYRADMRDIFLTLARLLYQKVACFEIVAEEDIIRERLSRPRLGSRADFSVYKQLQPLYEEIDHEHLVLKSGVDNVDSMLRQAKHYIGSLAELKS
jgi:predicted kinase